MDKIKEAQAKLKALLAELDGLTQKDDTSAEHVAAMKAKTAEVKAQEDLIATLKDAEDARARAAAEAIPAADRTVTRTDNLPAVPKREVTKDQTVSLVAAATLKSKLLRVPALKILEDGGYGQFAKELAMGVNKAVSVDTDLASVLIPDTISSQIIDMLRPETTFFQGGPKKVTFTYGKFKAARGATGASASYVGEGAKKPVTNPTFDSIDMAPKKLAAIVLITQEAKNWSLPDIDAYIRSDLRAAMSQAIDLNAYFGSGAGDSPRGILKTVGVPHITQNAAIAAPTLQQIDQSASAMILHLTQANIGASATWAWLMSYRTMEFLKNVRVGGDNDGIYAFPELRGPNPTWKGFRVLVSNQVPDNLGDDGDESSIALIDFRYVLYGEEGGVVVKTSDEATIDNNGTLVHLFQQNMYAILTEHQHDFGLQHLQAVVTLDGLKWGSGFTTSPGV